ncbi:hypothetical protein D917_09248 [Trichinella nativa]|uniref:Uncharacterized protein n=1 Tax=Trichinella nativa TaxID=6335 RepID=A0A1Y3EKC6_9BILA|nr:hypothetical protein D917_09248 [Trichinella nativa]
MQRLLLTDCKSKCVPDHEIVKPELHATGNQSEPPWLMRIHFGNRTHQLHLNTVDLENLFSPQLLTVERYNNRTLLNVGSNFAPLCRNHYRTTGTDHVHGALSLCEGMLASCPPNFFIQLCSSAVHELASNNNCRKVLFF